MNKFANFMQKVLTDAYDNILNNVIATKTPSALFVKNDENNAFSIASSLKNAGLNLSKIIVIDKSEAIKSLSRGVILTRL